MERRRRKTPWLALIIGVLCFAIAVAVMILIPPAINTAHVSHDLTPGSISLPPTAVPPTVTPGK